MPWALQASLLTQFAVVGLIPIIALVAGLTALAIGGLIGILSLLQIYRWLASGSYEFWRGAIVFSFVGAAFMAGLTVVAAFRAPLYGFIGMAACALQIQYFSALTCRKSRRFFSPQPSQSDVCRNWERHPSVGHIFTVNDIELTISEPDSLTASCVSLCEPAETEVLRPTVISRTTNLRGGRWSELQLFAVLIGCLMFIAKSEQAYGQSALPFTPAQPYGNANESIIVDADRTPEGAARLNELATKAKDLCKVIDRLRKTRRPHDAKRATMLGPYQQAQAALANANRVGGAANQAVANLNRQLKFEFYNNRKNVIRNNIRAAQQSQSNAEQAAISANQTISDLGPQIEAINRVIKPIDDQGLDAFRQLEECRQQWLRITRPDVKYARGDYEVLRDLLDTWLLTDGLWPDGMIWAGLCAYSTKDFRGAADYVQKVEFLRVNVFEQTGTDPKVQTLKAMIVRDRDDTDNRKSLRDARRWTTKVASELRGRERSKKTTPEPMAYFLLAKFHAGREPEHKQALKYYELARQHDPDSICAAAGLGQLQIESKLDDVQNLSEGVQLLQGIWDRCETKSWRLALLLIEGYRATDNVEKAEEMLRFVMSSDAVSAERKTDLKTALGI